jgi:Na+/melibiose symporter-like transporter
LNEERAHGADNAELEKRLPLRHLLLYSLPAGALGFQFSTITFYLLPFATDVLLLPAQTIGLIFGLSRVWDAAVDPVIGWLSDATRSRFGRRRPWMAAGMLPMAATFFMMWSPPAELAGDALALWLGGSLFVFYTALTMVDVPHQSLGAELSDAYHERTRIFGVRRGVFGIGALVATAGIYFITAAEDPREVAAAIATSGALLLVALVGLTSALVPERFLDRSLDTAHPWAALRDVWRNPHARRLLIVFLIQQVGLSSLIAALPYFSTYVMGTPAYTAAYLFTFLAASSASIPLWLALAPRFEKKTLFVSAMAGVGAALTGMLFVGPGQEAIVLLIAVVGGLAAGGADMLGPSIQADVIDYDELMTGERKEGIYFAMWAFVQKAAAGGTVALVGFVLAGVGFVPNAQQTPEALFAIRGLVGLLPAVLYTAGILAFLSFALDEREQSRIRRALAR